MKYISTSAVAKVHDIKPNDLFDKFKTFGWIERSNDKWILTELGKQKGGQVRNNTKYDEYIVWPDDIIFEEVQENKTKLINATAIGKHFNITSQRINLIIAEIGWISKDIAGWKLLKLGKSVGGKQFESPISGGTYVMWPETILINKNLTSALKDVSAIEQTLTLKDSKKTDNSFREKYPAEFRTKDGHMVRSRAEVIIDNALYEYKLAHAYERKLPIEEEMYSDFFIPSENVYIEFWGMESDPKYAERKKNKIEIYKKYDFRLIELNDTDILNLDDHLPKKLLKFNIKVY